MVKYKKKMKKEKGFRLKDIFDVHPAKKDGTKTVEMKNIKKQQYGQRSDNPVTPKKQALEIGQAVRIDIGGSYVDKDKPFSKKLRTKKGSKKKSSITGVNVRGKQIENKRGRK